MSYIFSEALEILTRIDREVIDPSENTSCFVKIDEEIVKDLRNFLIKYGYKIDGSM